MKGRGLLVVGALALVALVLPAVALVSALRADRAAPPASEVDLAYAIEGDLGCDTDVAPHPAVRTWLTTVGAQLAQYLLRWETQQTLLDHDRALAAARDGVVIADATQPGFPILYVNEGFERLTGYTEAEMLGRSCAAAPVAGMGYMSGPILMDDPTGSGSGGPSTASYVSSPISMPSTAGIPGGSDYISAGQAAAAALLRASPRVLGYGIRRRRRRLRLEP